jgi:hypothetical protein
VLLSSNETTISQGLFKLAWVVIVDSRMLDLYFLYPLTNHIQFRSVVLVDEERGGAFVKRRPVQLYNEGGWLIVGSIMVAQHFPW